MKRVVSSQAIRGFCGNHVAIGVDHVDDDSGLAQLVRECVTGDACMGQQAKMCSKIGYRFGYRRVEEYPKRSYGNCNFMSTIRCYGAIRYCR
jgi:hypothetical protein